MYKYALQGPQRNSQLLKWILDCQRRCRETKSPLCTLALVRISDHKLYREILSEEYNILLLKISLYTCLKRGQNLCKSQFVLPKCRCCQCDAADAGAEFDDAFSLEEFLSAPVFAVQVAGEHQGCVPHNATYVAVHVLVQIQRQILTFHLKLTCERCHVYYCFDG
jgi:hypothetical protein